jgi:hypothetical protein
MDCCIDPYPKASPSCQSGVFSRKAGKRGLSRSSSCPFGKQQCRLHMPNTEARTFAA